MIEGRCQQAGMTSPIVAEAQLLFQSGRGQQALELLGKAGGAGNADALEFLASICVAGRLVNRDLALARDLFRKAAEAGSAAGAAAYRAFVANGTGGPPDWGKAVRLLEDAAAGNARVRRELDLISAMGLSPEGNPPSDYAYEDLCASPKVTLFPALLSEAECDYMIDASTAVFEPSRVVDPQTGQLVPNPVRTSDAAAFPLVMESPAVHALNKRLAAASGTKVAQGEPLQILRYRPGQEYRPHFDAIAGAENQRILTFLVYLNDDYEGGETCFLTPGLEVKGRKGDGLLFRNADDKGRADANSQHAGLPVIAGEKLLASRWIRERPLVV